MYFPCRSLQGSIECLIVESSADSEASVSLRRTSVAFTVTASTLSNIVSLSSDFTLGSKKINTGLIRASTIGLQHGDTVFRKERLQRQSGMDRRIILVNHPGISLSHIGSSSSHSFTNGSQNLDIVTYI